MRPFRDLEPLSERALADVLAATRPRRFARGEVLFHSGDPGDTLHLVRRGRVMVYRTIGTGQRAVVGFLAAGDVVGEVALFSEGVIGRRSATVEALEPTETLVLGRERFEELRTRHPALADVFLRLLSKRVRALDELLTEALLAPAEVRVRRRLAALAGQIAGGSGDAVVPLTQDELAHAARTSRATTNRALREAERDGILALARGQIVVRDRNRLEARDRLVGWD
ncbi:MAG TPA: Crp/Fnr family transcriptional regulator [Miltoncostaeaceae bacterium]|nr:Crp/Fnr family transcriptional regulator [Miltoncostaeaceae bacterium]